MPFITRLKFWLLGLLLLSYILGVVILSAISLHGFKKGNSRLGNKPISPDKSLVPKPQLPKRVRSSDYSAGAFRPVLKRSKIHWCSELKFIPPDDVFGKQKPVALVSFPGSGNTWLRYLLQQATGYYTGSVYKDYGLLKNGFPAESIVNSSVLVVKTHEWGLNARNMFSKAILLVRAPDKSIQAEFNRQSGGHIGFASPDRYRRNNGKYWNQFVADNLRGWHQINMDWLYNFTGPTHVIFYEQLVDNTEHTLKTVINFLGVYVPEKKFQCAIEQKEGIYRRKRRVLNFDPFTAEMRVKIKALQEKVYNAIYKMAAPEKR
ncbi:unnamed protein product [Ceutorhynchus assimilis]|uniref:Sulfotransferase n=1 Tax=Ceutorhynchus assimilis TaxID=467358 RepID=A0A9N9MRA5_9CUCU|nr:unnamed protein product [Ceutorhynchus assimilis]